MFCNPLKLSIYICTASSLVTLFPFWKVRKRKKRKKNKKIKIIYKNQQIRLKRVCKSLFLRKLLSE